MDSLPLPAVPDYDIEQEIGSGRLTTVYRARRKSDGQVVSLKVVMPEFTSDRIFVRRFLDAAGRAIRLDHPNIARVYEVTDRDGALVVVREYVEAGCLADWLAQQGTISPEQAVPIVRQLASALDYAHSRRMMHGDINDRCIYVRPDGPVKIADFGLVQSVTGTDVQQSQSRGVKMVQGVGAPEYLAPERVQGQGPNRSADIYALGAIAYQLLAGHPPFAGEPEAVLEAQVYETPRLVHTDEATRSVSPTVSAAVARALAKRPELRYNTATEFARAFAAAAEGIAPARGTMVMARPKSGAPSRPRPTVLVGIVLLAIAVFLIAWLWNTTGLGQRLGEQLAVLLPSPVPPVPAVSPRAEAPTPSPTAAPSTVTSVPAPTATTPLQERGTTATPTGALTATPAASATPTLTPASLLPVSPAPVTVAPGSPFSNLVVAAGIDANNRPVSPANTFLASEKPLYLFFEYREVAPGATWGHIWLRGSVELNRTVEKWPAGRGPSGRAWVYYTPEGAYLPGAYEVRLLANDQVVASATFVVQ